MRQTDSLSFVYTYLDGFDFFHPANFNLSSQEGRAASEFPIFHYLHAVIIKVFSCDQSIIRILNLICVYFSLYYLTKTINYLLKRPFFAAFLAFLFYSSTVLVYYSFNFLPDPLALSFCFIGNYYVVLSLHENVPNTFLKASLFLILSSLIKPSFAIYMVAFFATSCFSSKWALKNYSIALICLLALVAWIIYVRLYNIQNNQHYYLTGVKPIWKNTSSEIDGVLGFVWNYWYSKYYYQSSIHLFLILLLALPFFIWKNFASALAKFTFFTLLGLVFYVLLFFIQFKDHDYYFIAMIPGVSILITYSLNCLLKLSSRKWLQILVISPVVIIALLSINYSREKLLDRMLNGIDKQSLIGYRLKGSEKFIDSLGIDNHNKFLVLGDRSVNGSLFFLKRRGWTIPDLTGNNRSEFDRILPETDYLVITNDQYILFHNTLYPMIKTKEKHYLGGTCFVKMR
jgi:hypothetical protein